LNLQELIDQTEEYSTLYLVFDEYVEQVIITKPITIDGKNSTICSTKGPVITVDSEDVILKNLRIEVISNIEHSSEDHSLALKANKVISRFENVIVKGGVKGVVNEDGLWQYPDVINIWPVAPEIPNYFEFQINVPVSCALETDISDLKIINPGMMPGKNIVRILVDGLKKDTILFGYIKIKSTYLIKIIGISGGSYGVPLDFTPNKDLPVVLETGIESEPVFGDEKESELQKKTTDKTVQTDSKTNKKVIWIVSVLSGIILSILIGYSLIHFQKKSNIDQVDLMDQEKVSNINAIKARQEAEKEAELKKIEEEKALKAAQEAEKRRIAEQKRIEELRAAQAAEKAEKEAAELKARQEAEKAAELKKIEEEKALKAAQEAEKRRIAEQKRIKSLLKLAEQYIKTGRFVLPKNENAFDIYEELLTVKNSYARKKSLEGLDFLLEVGNEYLKQDQSENASAIFSALKKSSYEVIRKKAIDTNVILGKYYFNNARLLMNNNECMKALTLLTKALDFSPGNFKIKNAIAAAKSKTGILNIYSEPWANIIIDSKDIERTSPANKIELICGKHQIELLNPDEEQYKIRRAEIIIQSGKITKLVVIHDKIMKIKE
jgi:hypothetical protein